MNAPAADAAPRPGRRTGRLAVIVFALGIAVVLAMYLFTLPEPWLRAFAAEIAARAAADPNPPLPEDTRQATPRAAVDNPLICLANVIDRPWERAVIVMHDTPLADVPVIAAAAWSDDVRAAAAAQLASDDRYQLIVLVDGGRVVDHQLFYTFWGDLRALARPEGFTPDTAIFTAQSLGGSYKLSVADGATASDCPR
ncbi:MAG: hypothetical protein SFV21_02110 [Rhodospirillaceae bacterium]|nr:hypothetical protein [Rhodospirillaceae bacterium]